MKHRLHSCDAFLFTEVPEIRLGRREVNTNQWHGEGNPAPPYRKHPGSLSFWFHAVFSLLLAGWVFSSSEITWRRWTQGIVGPRRLLMVFEIQWNVFCLVLHWIQTFEHCFENVMVISGRLLDLVPNYFVGSYPFVHVLIGGFQKARCTFRPYALVLLFLHISIMFPWFHLPRAAGKAWSVYTESLPLPLSWWSPRHGAYFFDPRWDPRRGEWHWFHRPLITFLCCLLLSPRLSINLEYCFYPDQDNGQYGLPCRAYLGFMGQCYTPRKGWLSAPLSFHFKQNKKWIYWTKFCILTMEASLPALFLTGYVVGCWG